MNWFAYSQEFGAKSILSGTCSNSICELSPPNSAIVNLSSASWSTGLVSISLSYRGDLMVNILLSLQLLDILIKSMLLTLMDLKQKWANAKTSIEQFIQISRFSWVIGILAWRGFVTIPLPAPEWKISLLLVFSWSVTAISNLKFLAVDGMYIWSTRNG